MTRGELIFSAALYLPIFLTLLLGILSFATHPLGFLNWWDSRSRLEHVFFLGITILLGTPALAAVRAFARVGRGTPIPCDPPKKLLTTGVFSYLRNPMQTSMVVTLAWWALYLESGAPLAISLVGLVYSLGLARWSEERDLDGRFGKSWQRIRQTIPAWFPLIRPQTLPEPAMIYFDFQCGPCRSLATWFQQADTVSLEILDARTFHGPPLQQVTYLHPDGTTEAGVAAIAAALAHRNFAWAFLGWLGILPGVHFLAEAAFGLAFTSPDRCPISAAVKK